MLTGDLDNFDPANPQPGVYPGLTYEQYDQWAGLRKTNLWTLNEQTPAHYKYKIDHPEQFDKECYLIGNAEHIAIRDWELFEQIYGVRPKNYTNKKGEVKPWSANATACKEEIADMQKDGKVVLSPEQYDDCRRMRDAVLTNETAAMLLQRGKSEVSMQWRDDTTMLLCKGRMDLWLPQSNVIADFKTARNAAPGPFGRAAYKYGYHFQMAMYQDGVRAATGEQVAPPILIAIEKTPPYCVACYEVERDVLELGRAQYKWALEKIVECQKTGIWPGYDGGLASLVMPGYAGMELSL